MSLDIKIITNKQVRRGIAGDDMPNNYKEMFLANPFACDDSPMQLRAICNNMQVGSVYAFPLEIVQKDVCNYQVCAGSSLSVDSEFRGRGIGGKLTMQRLRLMKDSIAIASGLSSMSLPIFKKKGFDVFMQKRWIYLQNSRPIIEMFLREGVMQKVAVKTVNCMLGLLRAILGIQINKAFKNLSVEKCSSVPQAVADIVAQENKLFRENHTKEWFEWVLNGSFVNDNRAKQHLYVVKNASDIIAFFMTKERFHEQASHRGFKNVILGSVIEWGVKSDVKLSVNKLLLRAIMSFGKHVDAVELCSANSDLNNFLKHRFLVAVGYGNFAIKADEDSPLYNIPEYHDMQNWRIRPAASDNSFN